MSEPLHQLCDRAGVVRSYHDIAGEERAAPNETLRAVLAAMALDAGDDAAASETLSALRAEDDARALGHWVVVEADTPARVPLARSSDWTLRREDGETAGGRGEDAAELPALPIGIHVLHAGDDKMAILAAPPRLPPAPRTWGITAPLYGLRTPDQGGIGDYGDLARAIRSAARHGAGFFGVNPIHAGFAEDDGAISPYSPSNRRRFEVMHIRTPGDPPAADGDLIDPARVRQHKRQALWDMFTASRGMEHEREFTLFRATEGEPLTLFAAHQALSHAHGPYWGDWPEALRDPRSAEVRAYIDGNERALRYHCWLQFEAERQLRQAADAAEGMAVGLYLDLAVGTHPHGAETWADPDAFARGVSLGAPPDAFTPSGQDWGLAPLRPRHLERTAFQALAETLRKQLAYAGMLRIDHILGFDRAFWVPRGDLPGTYVRMPREAMLAVARIEAARTGAVIVGEDLGNVPDGLRDDLDATGILGCRVMQFERHWDDDPQAFLAPSEYDQQALASFSTHDLPTWRGWREGRDVEWFGEVGFIDEAQVDERKGERANDVERFAEDTGAEDADAMHRYLARTASRVAAVQLEDILELTEQANLPGTVDAHPNWRRRMPVGAEALKDDDRLARVAGIMREAGR